MATAIQNGQRCNLCGGKMIDMYDGDVYQLDLCERCGN